MKLCIDCVYFKMINNKAICHRPQQYTGVEKVRSCMEERLSGLFSSISCSTEARYFKHKKPLWKRLFRIKYE